jgi:hypothetical protein
MRHSAMLSARHSRVLARMVAAHDQSLARVMAAAMV